MRSALCTMFASVVATILAVSPATAHAYLVESFPSAKQRLSKPLRTIRLVFSGRADAHYSTIRLESEDGTLLAAKTQAKAEHRLDLAAPPLQSGRYRVHYRVLSTDGDITEGRLEFFIESQS
jgi:methionine-rich copper-binding protein CopC